MRPTKWLDVTLARMREVSREPSTCCAARVDDVMRDLLLARCALEVFDVLACDCL